MRRLLPYDHPETGAQSEVDLEAAYAYPPDVELADRAWVRANFVMAADGSFAGPLGLSEGISGPADKRVFGLLRRLADVVVVGAGTARAEGYGPARLPVAVVTNRLLLDLGHPLFTEPRHRTIVITSRAPGADRLAAAREVADVVVAGEELVEMATAMAALEERGYRRILTEGGPMLFGEVVAAGLLDELCLTLSPLLAGGPAGILDGTALAAPVPLTTGHLLEEDGLLFARLVTPRSPGP
jgi:riboflavin biosynthesis pyrimidine reductase